MKKKRERGKHANYGSEGTHAAEDHGKASRDGRR